jgi:hypothetical protein
MKFLFKMIMVAAFFGSGVASADIIDRINDCERSGGADRCVYSILRELATSTVSQRDETISYCQCESSSYNCARNTENQSGRASSVSLKAYVENLRTGEVTSHRVVTCWNFQDGNAQSLCESALAKNPRCVVRNQ